MTTIAFDGEYLAADRRCSDGNRYRKIFPLSGGGYLAGAGALDDIVEVARWVDRGMLDTENPYADSSPKEQGSANFLYIDARGKPHTLSHPWLRPIPLLGKRAALGSGRDYAKGAMAAGMPAYTAVKIACKFDPNSGDGIDWVRVKRRRR